MPHLQTALKILKNGDVIGMPTETVYGLAGDITQEVALRKIFETKERPFFDPLIVHVADIEQAKTLTTEWSELADFLAKNFWPGPMTMVLPKIKALNPLITAGLDSVGIRCPNHPVALELLKQYGKPLAAPSANKFKKTSPTLPAHVKNDFPDLFVLDGGACEVGIESTVLAPIGNEIHIYRLGMITEEILKTSVKKFPRKISVNITQSPAAPGQLEDHYMPRKPLYIIEGKTQIPKNAKELILPESATLAARLLYQRLHELSIGSHENIYFLRKSLHRHDQWHPIMDRLIKASTK
ncbi:MAG: threonylcarbamoyl-AMP synthase [Bacteriovoracaceae bacterium]|nr:threonylcarbamoyl-AMP synthase [Bacteriovoracaceae bacterium]